ncbi:MAG: penicillin-binding protein, partial [Acidobacteria bacterium]
MRGSKGGSGLLPRDPILRAALLAFLALSMFVVGFFSYFYVKYDRIIEQRFRDPVFTNSAKIYAGPRMVRVGSAFTVREIAAELRHAGYGEKDGESLLGSYHVRSGSIEVLPGPESYHSPEPATITVSDGKVSQIRSRSTGDLSAYELEPQLVTSLFDAEQRSKRTMVKYDNIPKVMVDAVIS